MPIDNLGEGAIQRLVAIEAIKQLKARFCRFLDCQSWTEWHALFVANAMLEFEYPAMRFSNADEFVALSIEVLERVRTVHRVHAPEIELLSADRARGVWAMDDVVELRGEEASSWHGYGHYHEEYRRVDGDWRIASLRLTRLRVDEHPERCSGVESATDLVP
jgi:hypothetical protein